MKRIELFFVVACTLYAAFRASATTRYVDLSSTNPTPPYTDWIIAAMNIQDAVDAAVDGDEILVTNGVYATGGRVVYGALTNRAAINKAVAVRSINGPSQTVIAGAPAVGGTWTGDGDGAIRCVYVGTNAVLSGFTLTNGHTRAAGDISQEQSGAGAWCELSGIVSNCILSGNAAWGNGGGAYSGTLSDCTLSGNAAPYGGGAYNSALNRCTLNSNWGFSLDGQWNGGYGGGAYYGTLNNCTLSGNHTPIYGGGACYSILSNCTVTGSSVQNAGGGAFSSILFNSTLSGNQAPTGAGAAQGTLNNCTLIGNWAWQYGGGATSATLRNCIVYYNNGQNCWSCSLAYSCTTPLAAGIGNITNEPLFVNTNGWADLRLQSNSPCINSGCNVCYATGPTDLDGYPRISGGRVDLGAYEFQNPTSIISYAWLQSYGLPTDGSADYADTDRDGMNNWQEWVCDTNPTNAASVLRMISAKPGATNVVVTWSSVSSRTYSVERATNLVAVPAFSVLKSNIPGPTGTTSFTDTNPPAGRAAFYRVAAQSP